MALPPPAQGMSRERDVEDKRLTCVMKFGGSSVATGERMREVADLILAFPEESPVIVLSAMGKTTNNLLLAGEKAVSFGVSNASEIEELSIIKELHLRTVAELKIDPSVVTSFLEELEQLLKGIAMMKELTLRSRDYLVSFGECMSTRIFATYLNKIGVKARQSPNLTFSRHHRSRSLLLSGLTCIHRLVLLIVSHGSVEILFLKNVINFSSAAKDKCRRCVTKLPCFLADIKLLHLSRKVHLRITISSFTITTVRLSTTLPSSFTTIHIQTSVFIITRWCGLLGTKDKVTYRCAKPPPHQILELLRHYLELCLLHQNRSHYPQKQKVYPQVTRHHSLCSYEEYLQKLQKTKNIKKLNLLRQSNTAETLQKLTFTGQRCKGLEARWSLVGKGGTFHLSSSVRLLSSAFFCG
ncbi:hypothetical protein Rs2_02659 [Raphanus sativus]|nr:hypothetical protein Rs2_02659 [Raphanus sativus]